jgi:NAD+ kinase
MTEIEPANLETALKQLIEGELETECRMMLNGHVIFKDGGSEEDWALNDIVIARSGSLKSIQYSIYVNGQFLSHCNADGVIISTPTGSTGYNLSAGGPLVEPGAKLIMLTQICPHTLNQRSIILSPEDVIEIVIPRNKEGQRQKVDAIFDGGDVITLHTDDRIHITKSEKVAEIIQLNRVSFLELLHRKLGE